VAVRYDEKTNHSFEGGHKPYSDLIVDSFRQKRVRFDVQGLAASAGRLITRPGRAERFGLRFSRDQRSVRFRLHREPSSRPLSCAAAALFRRQHGGRPASFLDLNGVQVPHKEGGAVVVDTGTREQGSLYAICPALS
jgi:hypothetical protein